MKERSVNHKMLTLARDFRGYTQTQLAKEVKGISQGNLSRMEKGLLDVPDEALSNISEVLGMPKDFFFQDSVRTAPSDIYHRKRIAITKKKLSLIESERDIIRMGIDVLFSDFELPEFTIPPISASEKLSPGEIARKIRTIFGIPRGPIHNLVNHLETSGITVISQDVDTDKFDGVTLFSDRGYPLIFLNESMPNDRLRFTLAHELGHIVLHRSSDDEKTIDDKEKEANQFAAEFLMPELDIRNDLVRLSLTKLFDLKAYWMVSMRSLIYRAKSIGVITAERAKNLYIEMSRNGYVKEEPINVPLDKPEMLSTVISMLKNDLDYSIAELAEAVRLSEDDYCRLFERKKTLVKLKARKAKGQVVQGGKTIIKQLGR